MEIVYHRLAQAGNLPYQEMRAMLNAVKKLEEFGTELGFPHSSAVRGAALRELRRRAERNPWRAFYRRVGERIVIGGIGPEAQTDPAGFRAMVLATLDRLAEVQGVPGGLDE